MAYSTVVDGEDEIEFFITDEVGKHSIARFEDIGNGMTGMVDECDEPYRLSAGDMIQLARWLLEKAQDRLKDGGC